MSIVKKLKREEKVGIVVGSLIIGLLMILDKPQASKGSVINLKNIIRKSIRKTQGSREEHEQLAIVCSDAMMMLLEQHLGEKSKMHVATFIETLSFDFEKELSYFYGMQYMTTMLRFCEKQSNDGKIHDSYTLADDLRDNIRKLIFDGAKL